MFSIIKLFINHVLRPKNCRWMAGALGKIVVNRNYFVWIDLEMTGLDCEIHKIVEIACLITDSQLNILHDGFHLIIHQPLHVFENECHPWAKAQHEKSGLMQLSLNSKISISEANDKVATYIKEHTNYDVNNGSNFLAGNTVYMDKRFLEKYMPSVNDLVHYRIIDVSTIKTLHSAWCPNKLKYTPLKKREHRALDDIKESIMELKYYKSNFFVQE